ncbi:MAG: polyphosphate kinase 1 [Flavobacteriales bacterium]|nr:MAG: polyphosphate kinase 1 [Flavobacteriales bacterium]
MRKYTFKNRELSWLDFNERVLQEAADITVPLIERLRFIGIFSNNLDEFYKVRYATVKRLALSKKKVKKFYKGENAKDLLNLITERAIELQNRSNLILDFILKDLEKENIFIADEQAIPKDSISYIKSFFLDKIQPKLKIVLLNEKDDFPQLSESSCFLIIKVESKNKNLNYAIVQFPDKFERFIVIKNQDVKYVIMIDDIIRYHLFEIFKIFNPSNISANMIKFSRDAELDFDDDISKSYLEKISQSVKDRLKGDPLRFVYDKEIDPNTLKFLLEKMNINSEIDSIIPGGKYHNKKDYMNFPILNNDLAYDKIQQLVIKDFYKHKTVFESIDERDFLVHTPFHKFNHILTFLSEASIDPEVKRICITIYRLSKLSSVANTLINAAKNGKEVVVQIELQARFDETNNIDYAKLMQDQGVKLIFGIPTLKVHAKVCVVEKLINNKILKYGFISTGNFNESTAKIYTDFTIFTSNQSLLDEISNVFEFFSFNYKKFKYEKLIISPYNTKKFFKSLIKNEIKNAKRGKDAFIKIKLNNITNYEMIKELYKAAEEGVKIYLIVRGICCLIPDQKNTHNNIELISIVDKFLEHTRMFIFCNNGKNKTYISSADWMTRNLDNRVEVTIPIEDEKISNQLNEIFSIYWNDNQKSRYVNSENNNEYRKNELGIIRSQSQVYNYHHNEN